MASWAAAARSTYDNDERPLVFVHLFAGQRHPEYLQHCIESLASQHGVSTLILSAELDDDPV